jgi:hypothetical protein
MFRKIGLQIRWGHAESSKAFQKNGQIAVLVHLVTGGMQDTAGGCRSSTGFGCAYSFDTSDGAKVIVNYDRIHERIWYRPRLFHSLLAHVIAHEVTHVIEVRDYHSSAGVMKQHWTTKDLMQMENSPLEFTDEDVEFIQKGFDYRSRRR